MGNTYSTNTVVAKNISQSMSQINFAGLCSFIIISAVLIFVAVYVYTFIKSMDPEYKSRFLNRNKKQNDSNFSLKREVEKRENPEIQFRTCFYCGTKNDGDSRFCKSCGKKIQ